MLRSITIRLCVTFIREDKKMPFPRTWIEELVVEWLQLEGFLAQSNIPVAVTPAGGRFEADVIGARISQNTLQIRHIETGQLASGRYSIKSVEKKFSESVVQSVTNHFRKRFSFSEGNVIYEKMYIATFSTKSVVAALAELGITVETVPQFIQERVLPTIQAWKQNPPHQPQTKGQVITLPESNWLLQMLDHLTVKGLLNIGRNENEMENS